ncbi:hypothetical protein BH10ACI2_BH10ACI2_01470 [soil metagenome]
MITARETKQRMIDEPRWWKIALMDFVDDFRYHRDSTAINKPFELGDDEKDAVLAATIETLCDEMALPIPEWLGCVPPCREPFFLSRMESIKAFSLVESPAHFRVRRVFVCDNFLFRV